MAKLSFDEINEINMQYYDKDMNRKEHYVAVNIDTKSPDYKDKIYYYRTTKDYQVGETFRAKMPSGGDPFVTVVGETELALYGGEIKVLNEE